MDITSFDDYPAQRQRLFDSAESAAREIPPVENSRFSMELTDVGYRNPKDYSIEEQKDAIMKGKSLGWALHGTWNLRNKSDGAIVSSAPAKLGSVPYLTERGTYIRNGSEYTVVKQARLKPGIYSRQRENGELEAHVNVAPGSGRPFKLILEPDTGKFKINVGQAALPLAATLRAMGVSKEELKNAWGEDLLFANEKSDPKLEQKLKKHFGRTGDPDVMDWAARFSAMQLDPDVIEKTLGLKDVKSLTPAVLLEATKKLLAINRGDADTDDRDSLAFMTLHDVADGVAERIKHDAGGVRRLALWKATNINGDLSKMRPNMFDDYIDLFMNKSGLAAPLEEINPLEIHDQNTRITRMGAGGIPSDDSIPNESRNVQPTHFGFIDPIRTAESGRAGVDLRLTAVSGKRGHELVTPLLTPDGKTVYMSPKELHGSTIAFANEDMQAPFVRAMQGGEIKFVKPSEVQFLSPRGSNMFSGLANMIPAAGSMKGHRLLMGSKMLTQAMALREPEAPLVQSSADDANTTSYEALMGEKLGAVRSGLDGIVEKVTPGQITVLGPGGKKKVHQLYDNFPLNRKSFLHNESVVKPGDRVAKNQVLARSNYTDKDGTAAVGRNLRTAYAYADGLNYEDAIVISESAARKMASEHMYTHESPEDPSVTTGKKPFISVFPSRFNSKQLASLGDNGVIKPGTTVHYGDPLILAMGDRKPSGASAIYRSHKLTPIDHAVTWDHKDPGVVTDSVEHNGRHQVAVKSYRSVDVGDKLSNRYGGKGVVSKIYPDDQMLQDKAGNPMDIILSPQGLISRGNPAQIIAETSLGKLARHTGKPQLVPAFSSRSNVEYAINELAKHGLSDTEDLFDPVRNVPIKDVFTGDSFFLRLHHMAEDKESGRGAVGDAETAYTIDRLPAKGGDTGAKRLSVQDINALLSHGATNVLRDAHLIKGQRNDDYWRALRLGYNLPTPRGGFVHDKFLAYLNGAGINTRKKGNALQIMAMTDKDIDKLSRGPITSSNTVDPRTLDPAEGGLFDLTKTGGHDGRGWTHIDLSEPMPNPIAADVIKSLMGWTDNAYRTVIGGGEVDGVRGTKGMQEALQRINIPRETARAKAEIESGRATRRDKAVKRLGFLDGLQKSDLSPADLMWTKVPVLPPAFRPIVRVSPTKTLATDANELYRDLFHANEALGQLHGKVESSDLGDERLGVYQAMEAVMGLGDPVGTKSQQQGLKGILAKLFGKSPKFGLVQRAIISKPQDLVGRGVITPDPGLDLDQVSLPTDMGWAAYGPFVMRRLVRDGASATDAAAYVKRRDPIAKQALLKEMGDRPVLMSRAPTLHRFSIQAFWPKLTGGSTIGIPPMVTPGFGADFDGDATNIFVPVSDEAKRDAIEKMLPSKNLLDSSRFEVAFAPKQEYLWGLSAASGRIGRPGNKAPRVFRSKADALAAYRRGEIGLRDAVEIRS